MLSTGAIMVSKIPNTPERVQALKEIDNHPTIKKWAECCEGELWFPPLSTPLPHQTECSVLLLGEISQNIYASHSKCKNYHSVYICIYQVTKSNVFHSMGHSR